MSSIRCECEYCGHKWTVEQGYGWRSHADACERCKEAKCIKRREENSEKCDVFGYRFSAPFPKKWGGWNG